MDDRDLIGRLDALPDRFADRVPGPQLGTLRSLAEGGEYEELLDALLAGLRKRNTLVTAAERDDLGQLLRALHLPTRPLGRLHVAA
jgi:hypothetical protein